MGFWAPGLYVEGFGFQGLGRPMTAKSSLKGSTIKVCLVVFLFLFFWGGRGGVQVVGLQVGHRTRVDAR